MLAEQREKNFWVAPEFVYVWPMFLRVKVPIPCFIPASIQEIIPALVLAVLLRGMHAQRWNTLCQQRHRYPVIRASSAARGRLS